MADEQKNTGKSDETKKTDKKSDGSQNTELNYQEIFNKGFKASEAKRIEQMNKLQEQLDELSEYKSQKEKEAEEAENKKLQDKEQYQKVIENLKKTHGEEKSKLIQDLNSAKESLKERIIKTKLYQSVSDVDVIPEAINDVVNLAYDAMDYTVEESDGKKIEKVYPVSDGSPMINEKTGQPLTVKEYFEKLLDQKPFFKKSVAQGGSGGQHSSGFSKDRPSTARDAISQGIKKLRK